ncbi:MAG: HEAT repeat domain-containing protein [Planctomycetota bacterium]
MSSASSDPKPAPNPAGLRPEELPPVTPPSAGYIVQLFLIPALIVLAVVSVWALFGKLADTESDWQQLVSELGSSNEHRRWRAAIGIAQLLKNEELAPPVDRAPLAQHPQVVDSLTSLLSESLASTRSTPEQITHQEFLARTMSVLRDDAKTLPVLAEAMKEPHAIDVRKSALMAVATIAGRHFDEATGYNISKDSTDAENQNVRPVEAATITNPEVLEQLRITAQSPDPVLRHLAAFAIGNVGGEKSIEQLKVLLGDSDRFARANAAMGLARNGSTECVPVLMELMKDAVKPFDQTAVQSLSENEQRLAENSFQVEQPQIVRNSLKASADLWPKLSEDQRREVTGTVSLVAESFFDKDCQVRARDWLRTHGAE